MGIPAEPNDHDQTLGLKERKHSLLDEFKFKTAFNHLPRPTVHISSLPPTELYSTKTAQPVGICECKPWAVPYETEASQNSFVDGVQFGSTLHRTQSSGPSIHSATNPFNDLEMNDQEEQPHFFGLNNGSEELKEQPSKNMVFRGERCEGHEEESVNQNPTVNSSCTEEHNNAFTAETGGDRVSEGNGNLKEIADILLMMKQKNKYP
ncbi:hypothetical protein QTP86_009126 [Hemibagrus guttatus]|nr:hypothetical protein QTP86_009126 [Hemibagrus guttatus]